MLDNNKQRKEARHPARAYLKGCGIVFVDEGLVALVNWIFRALHFAPPRDTREATIVNSRWSVSRTLKRSKELDLKALARWV